MLRSLAGHQLEMTGYKPIKLRLKSIYWYSLYALQNNMRCWPLYSVLTATNRSVYLHILQQLIKLDRSTFLLLCLNEFKLVRVQGLLSNSFDQKRWPQVSYKVLSKALTVSNRGKLKSLLLSVYCVFLQITRSETLLGTSAWRSNVL